MTSCSTVALEYLAGGGDLYLVQTAADQRYMYQALTSGLAMDFDQWDGNSGPGSRLMDMERPLGQAWVNLIAKVASAAVA